MVVCRVISVAVAAVRTSLPWNVCTFAVCSQSLSCQLPQMTVTALLVFYILWVQQRPVCSLQSELINHQTHLSPGAMAIKIALLGHYSCYGGVTSSNTSKA